MIVSWNWLKQYVLLDMPVAALEERLMMAGLNHESTADVGGDLAIDLEVTSNRPDCLGHLGIAREVAALWGREVKLPAAAPKESGPAAAELTKVTLRAPELCHRYTARVIRGVKIGPSPDWMVRRLATLGIAAINNVADITNYVLFECGQPLHAFDLARLRGREIIVRDAQSGEKFLAINHKLYELAPGMCVIADAERPVALAGVMGGAESEISAATTELLIESAEFSPVSIRGTARKLNLHSDSSHRFERGVDPAGVDWASRRCCELILQLAGGELAAGAIDVGRPASVREPVVLRLPQLKRVLGIDIPESDVRRILKSLGLEERRATPAEVEVIPPSWRRDLTREIDLVEEVARIHGYQSIPEDVPVPLAPSHRTVEDRVLEKVRHVLTALGYDEAVTLSAVEEEWSAAFSPWTAAPPLLASTPVLRRADRLRRSVVPSLLGARRTNETLANPVIELFEIARAYLPRAGQLPDEWKLIALSSGGDYFTVKGAIEALVAALNPAAIVEARDTEQELLGADAAELSIGGRQLGYLGSVSQQGLDRFELRRPTTVAEIRLSALIEIAELIPQYVPQGTFPASHRDLNFVVDESVRWGELADCVRSQAGPMLEDLQFRETYRSDDLRAAGKKSLLLTVSFRSPAGTLTSDDVDRFTAQIVAACRQRLGSELRTQ